MQVTSNSSTAFPTSISDGAARMTICLNGIMHHDEHSNSIINSPSYVLSYPLLELSDIKQTVRH